jgi:starch synthase
MHIVHLTSELSPIAKVGGLGDVVHGLAKQQAQSGHRVEIILPRYDTIHFDSLSNLKMSMRDLWSYENSEEVHNSVWSARIEELSIYLIEPHHTSYYFNRGKIYGETDDITRFLYFTKTALEFLLKSRRQPDLIHIHDWPTAIAAPLLKETYHKLGLAPGGVVLTIHNLEHQGKCVPRDLSRIGLRGGDFLNANSMQDPLDPTLINLLKGGIEFSNAVTTVSPRYAQEIKTPLGGASLHDTILRNNQKIHGILNGIDTEFWNPAKDHYLTHNYNPEASHIRNVLKQKKSNKELLLKKLHIQPTKGPLITSITRLAHQKCPDLIKEAILYTIEKKGQFVLLGSTCDKEIEREFLKLKNNPSLQECGFIQLTFDEIFAHQLYASADAIIIPSLYEPCGLTQMIGMRYGTVPIVRRTGGLADTIFDIDLSDKPLNMRTGFTFDFPDPAGIHWVIDRVFDCYQNNQGKWQTIIQNGLTVDVSWSRSEKDYEKLYRSIVIN